MLPHYSADSTPTSQAHMQQGNKMDREQMAGDDDGHAKAVNVMNILYCYLL
jgi:hypothetical protein